MGRSLGRQNAVVGSFTSYDGTRLAYHEQGDGTPLVCLPGGPGCAAAYLGDLGGLAAYRRVVRLDTRGTGDSAVPADPETYRCDRLVDDVEALRAHLGLDTMDLLGHSAATGVAMLYATRYPHRLRRMILVTPSCRAAGLNLSDEERYAAIERRAGEPWYAEAYAATVRLDKGEPDPADELAAVPLSFGRWDAAAREWVESGAFHRFEPAQVGFYAPGALGEPARTRAALGALDVPVLAVGGDLDPAPTPRLVGELSGLFRHGRTVIIPGSGHFPWVDDPVAFVAAVEDFLGPRA